MALVMLGVLGVGGLVSSADEGTRIKVTQVDAGAFPEVRIVASVTDAAGRAVRGLTAADLTVSEDGVLQNATIDLASETSPVAIALVLDTSGSMSGRALADAKAAMVSLIQALSPADQAAVITFSVDVRIDRPLTTDKPALVAAANGANAGGNTAIYDALTAAVAVLDNAQNARRAIILLTDGVDNSSRISPATAVAALAGAQVPTHVIALGNDLDRPALVRIATAVPGGELIEAPTSSQLAAIYTSLSEQLLTQYSVSYRSSSRVPEGTTLTPELTLRRAGAVIATASASFRVPTNATVPATATVTPTVAVVAPSPAAQPAAVAPLPRVRISSEVIGLLGAAAVLTLLLWVSELASRFPSRQRRRLEIFVRGLALTSPEHAKRRSIVQRVIAPTLRSASRPLMRITPVGVVASTRERLLAAGEPMGLGPSEFLGVRAGLAMLGAIAGLAGTTALTGNAGSAPLGTLGGAFLGYAVPGFVIDRIGNGRKAEIRRALPAALDMLALSAEAGLSFDGSIGQVAHRWNTALSQEFRRLLVEFQMGRERRQALRELAQRTGVSDLERFASAVIQADSLGVPLSGVLHEQSAEIRRRRRQRAEEAAHKAPVKMLFPMVLFIFPALFVVVLGPAVPRVLEAFQAFN
ncbi:MAG TPA: VWA domain-containing protein [Candidatus Limnocylindria bacterium]